MASRGAAINSDPRPVTVKDVFLYPLGGASCESARVTSKPEVIQIARNAAGTFAAA